MGKARGVFPELTYGCAPATLMATVVCGGLPLEASKDVAPAPHCSASPESPVALLPPHHLKSNLELRLTFSIAL